MDECEASVVAVRPGAVCRVRNIGCTNVTAYWKHWPCLFPQHGVGPKHLRRMALEKWQEDIVGEHAGAFVRGLVHSDGCRVTNWTERTVAGSRKRYEYPRYFFSNASAGIVEMCCWALNVLEIQHTHPKRDVISIARRDAVARLDELVGPKS